MEDQNPVTEQPIDEILPAAVGDIPEESLLPATVGDATSEEASQTCPKCGVLMEGNVELQKGRPRRQPMGKKLVKLAPVMLVCSKCGFGYELVGLDRGKVAQRPKANAESLRRNKRKTAKAARKANRR